jgi:hypothetical protein
MRTSSRAGVRLEKLPEGSATGTKVSAKAQSVEPGVRGPSDLGLATQDIGAPLTLKNHKVSVQEQNFIREYRHLEDLEREKGIKFFSCIGDPPITQETIETIKSDRARFIADTREYMRQRDISRFHPTFDSDRVVVEVGQTLPNMPKWDNFENNHFAMRKRLVSIWLKAANLLITRNRAGKRLQKIKYRLRQAGVKTRADARKFVIEDWKQA